MTRGAEARRLGAMPWHNASRPRRRDHACLYHSRRRATSTRPYCTDPHRELCSATAAHCAILRTHDILRGRTGTRKVTAPKTEGDRLGAGRKYGWHIVSAVAEMWKATKAEEEEQVPVRVTLSAADSCKTTGTVTRLKYRNAFWLVSLVR